MQPYQEEYVSNLQKIAGLTGWRRPEGMPFADYSVRLLENEEQAERLARRNMELLRSKLFPVLDALFEMDGAVLAELAEFSLQLFNGQKELDVGLFCRIRQALLTVARQKRDRNAMIRELYWLGMGRYKLCSKLVGIGLDNVQKYMIRMRLCFTEAAAYLKYYDELEDTETRGYILRSRANMALGQFRSPGEKVRLVKQTLQILQDREYQEKAPELPWERYIYMTHQHMAASISYSKDKVMTAEDMTTIMESVYIVYQRRIQEAEEQMKQPPARSAFNYYAIEYYCGIDSLDRLLQKVEDLLDSADPEDFSEDGMYCVVSLPAFYCQYLQQYPERLQGRKKYVEELYWRALSYVDSFGARPGEKTLFQFLRQLIYTFVETENSIPYGEFVQMILMRFAPEVYVHSQVVGEGARTLCGIILEDDPSFFDDMEQFRAITDPEEKRRELLSYAMGCGEFHDVGKINVIELYSGTGRQWFGDEYEMAQLHTIAGEALLAARPSTRRYAPIALGHHSWHDGSRGYPEAYRRLEHSSRQMVDVICLIDWLENVTHTARICTGEELTFDEAVQAAVKMEGKRFSPLLTAFLQEERVAEQLHRSFAEGRQNAYRRMYDDLRHAAKPE